jgi:DNA-binding transcriptional MerR regulator
MKKNKFRIGELAEKLGVERFVIRFWEKEFGLSSSRSNGGQRFYDADDFSLFVQIKQLLYEQGFTISGAKKQLTSKIPKASAIATASIATSAQLAYKTEWDGEIVTQIGSLKEQLKKLRELL